MQSCGASLVGSRRGWGLRRQSQGQLGLESNFPQSSETRNRKHRIAAALGRYSCNRCCQRLVRGVSFLVCLVVNQCFHLKCSQFRGLVGRVDGLVNFLQKSLFPVDLIFEFIISKYLF